jgi:hypothetical protein
VAQVAIRAPSVDALFDEWSTEPLVRRPLNDEARERIVNTWIRVRKQATDGPSLRLQLPEEERRDGLDATIAAAIHKDMETMAVQARRHWIRRSFRPREVRIGFAFFFCALLIAYLIDIGGDGESFTSQTFVVLGWVALWAPAQRVITGASFRIARKYFAELADAEVTVVWE